MQTFGLLLLIAAIVFVIVNAIRQVQGKPLLYQQPGRFRLIYVFAGLFIVGVGLYLLGS